MKLVINMNYISIISYYSKIVANGFTGIDVDKMDYFARDSHSVGLPNNFDWRYSVFYKDLDNRAIYNRSNV